jgi:Icc-related predicted phosphoesterase
MKLLLFSDLHTDTAAAARLVELAKNVDVVIGAGDFANARHNISRCIAVLQRIEVPTVLVPGNNESYDELVAACRSWRAATVLHGSSKEIAGQVFFGIGGGIPVTPFGAWSYDFSEADAEKLLASCPTEAVLVSHSPPKGAVDVSSSGQSFGSTAVRDAVIRLSPRLVVCGHIHESAGQRALIGKTPVINAGPKGLTYTLEA